MRAFEPQAGFTHMAPNRSSFNQRTNIEDSQLLAVIDAKIVNCANLLVWELASSAIGQQLSLTSLNANATTTKTP